MSLDDFTNIKENEECYDVNRRGKRCDNKATWAYLLVKPDMEQDVPGLSLYFCDVCKPKWEEEFGIERWAKLGRA